MIIINNKARCLKCGEIVESTHRHDLRSCTCGNLTVDGGHDYLRRVCRTPESEDRSWEELSKWEEEPEDTN